MGIPMSFWGHEEWGNFSDTCFKRKNRWKFIIPSISASGVNSLPPLRGGKPSFSFKEMQGEHLNETIYFPSKPDWKPISLTLYDLAKGKQNPIFNWLQTAYDPADCSQWRPSCGGDIYGDEDCRSLKCRSLKCAQAYLVLYDGCGNIVERWIFEHIWPQSLEFTDGDMAGNELVVCDVTLRYDRGYIDTPFMPSELTYDMKLPTTTCNAQISPTPAMSMLAFQPVPTPEFIRLERIF
jgi:hypothetical protein